MFYYDHAPPHFHASFDWELARGGQRPEPVAPLE